MRRANVIPNLSPIRVMESNLGGLVPSHDFLSPVALSDPAA
jgi:hypothetical protein